MINVVHRQGLQVDQWTGETMCQMTRFKIPRKGGKLWGGCFGTPSTALSGLAQYIEEENLDADTAHELYDLFQSSLRRKPGFESVKFTSAPAPSYKNLTLWGGGQTLEEYHKLYDHDFQVKAFSQAIILGGDEDESVKPGTDPSGPGSVAQSTTGTSSAPPQVDEERPLNAPKKWRLSVFGGDQSGEAKLDMPRCVCSFIEFLKGHITDPGVPGAVVLYLHPTQNNLFGVGSPADWHGTVNRTASEKLGHIPVFGTQTKLFHKNKLRDTGSNNRKRKRSGSPLPKNA